MTHPASSSPNRRAQQPRASATSIEHNIETARQMRAEYSAGISRRIAAAIGRWSARSAATLFDALSKLRPGAITFRRNRAGQPC